MSTRTIQRIGGYAVVAAVVAALVSPLLAVAYFATSEGAKELEAATVALWAEPARTVFGGLVTFAGPDRVYATYTQILALVLPAIVLSAVVARSRRPLPRRRSESIGWGIALTGYTMFSVGLLAVAVGMIGGDPSVPIVDLAFMAFMLPGLLVSLIGSTWLGVVLLRSGYAPRLTAWLLALAIPLWLVGNIGFGHNSIGIVPLFVAWAVTGWGWRTAGVAAPVPNVGFSG
jgi:hypothetical protein